MHWGGEGVKKEEGRGGREERGYERREKGRKIMRGKRKEGGDDRRERGRWK